MVGWRWDSGGRWVWVTDGAVGAEVSQLPQTDHLSRVIRDLSCPMATLSFVGNELPRSVICALIAEQASNGSD